MAEATIIINNHLRFRSVKSIQFQLAHCRLCNNTSLRKFYEAAAKMLYLLPETRTTR